MSTALTPSKLAAYKGLIALAWADHKIVDGEKAHLCNIIYNNSLLSEEHKQILCAALEEKINLVDIWEDITELDDRVFLLNMANAVFHKDGDYCKTEQELYGNFLSKHLSNLDQEAILKDICALAISQKAERALLETELKIYEKQYSLMGRLSRLFSTI